MTTEHTEKKNTEGWPDGDEVSFGIDVHSNTNPPRVPCFEPAYGGTKQERMQLACNQLAIHSSHPIAIKIKQPVIPFPIQLRKQIMVWAKHIHAPNVVWVDHDP